MTRKMLTATLLVAALLLSVLAVGAFGTQHAEAQGSPTCPYSIAVVGSICADAQAYPGPFSNAPAIPGGPFGWGSLNPVAGTAGDGSGAAAGGTGGGLAVTGNEATVLAYAGVGFIAFGAVALGSRRKFFQGTLD